MSGSPTKRLDFKDLSSMRFIAACCIMLLTIFPFANRSFTNSSWAQILNFIDGWAYAGIDFFITLSAFLITANALREIKYYGSFNLNKFFIRRAMKILPLYYIMILLGFIIVPAMLAGMKMGPINLPEKAPFAFFYGNFHVMAKGPYFTNILLMPALICVFIQIYFFWGIMLKFMHQYLIPIAIVLIIAGIGIRFYDGMPDTKFIYHPLYYGSNIGIGALLAVMVRKKGVYFSILKAVSKKNTQTFYLIALGVLLFGYGVLAYTNMQFMMGILSPLCIAYLIFDQSFGKNSPFQLKHNKVFSKWGRYSYGIYMYHGIVTGMLFAIWSSLNISGSFAMNQIIFPLSCLATTLIVSRISFVVIEQPIYRIKRMFKLA